MTYPCDPQVTTIKCHQSINFSDQTTLSPTDWRRTCSINPTTITFKQMTEILDSLRKTHFLPFLKMAGTLIPMHPVEVTRLNDIASKLNRYERCGAWDIRSPWLFSTIAGPEEFWAGEFLVRLGLGLEVTFGYPEISVHVVQDIIFMSDLRRRLPVLTK